MHPPLGTHANSLPVSGAGTGWLRWLEPCSRLASPYQHVPWVCVTALPPPPLILHPLFQQCQWPGSTPAWVELRYCLPRLAWLPLGNTTFGFIILNSVDPSLQDEAAWRAYSDSSSQMPILASVVEAVTSGPQGKRGQCRHFGPPGRSGLARVQVTAVALRPRR